MPYPIPEQLTFPIEPYTMADGYYKFGTPVRSRMVLWARHLGDDLVVAAGTPVQAIGAGEVVWAGVRVGSEARRNWGGLLVLAHQHKKSQIPNPNDQTNPKSQFSIPEVFYSVYGHMKNLRVNMGETVQVGQVIGEVAAGLTPENGWWKIPHLHFAMYVGPWSGEILPGYKRPFDGRTKMRWWRNPKQFIEEYNKNSKAE